MIMKLYVMLRNYGALHDNFAENLLQKILIQSYNPVFLPTSSSRLCSDFYPVHMIVRLSKACEYFASQSPVPFTHARDLPGQCLALGW